MAIKVNSNNLIFLNNLNSTTDRLATAMGRLSTGYRINSASDGAAELMLSKGLEKQISGLSVCNDNANMARNVLSVADGSLSQITQMAQRIRDIALSSANGVYGEAERQAYQSEVDGLVEEIKRQTNDAKYNDYKLFYGNTSPAIKTMAQGAQNAGTTGVVGTYKVQKVSQEEAEAQGYTCVSTAQELKNALVAGDANCKVMLMADINLDDLGVDATGSNWSAVGDATTKFQGTLDGNGYTIKNLKMNATGKHKGLIGHTHTTSTIKNLNINNANINNSNAYTAILIGENLGVVQNCMVTNSTVASTGTRTGGLVGENKGEIANCEVEITIEGGDDYTGGLVGANYSNIKYSSSTGSVVGKQAYVGGLAGVNSSSGNISGCSSNSNVIGESHVGGFVGVNNNSAVIESCYSTGNVVGNESTAGGFAGFVRDTSSIASCYATGNVVGSTTRVNTGGFVGRIQNSGSVSFCYSTSNVSGKYYTGGFAGIVADSGAIDSSYCTGNISCTGIKGGFLGHIDNSATLNNYAFSLKSDDTLGTNGVGSGTASGADDTAGKDASWFKNKDNLISIIGSDWDYSYLSSNLTFQIGVNAGSLNTLDVNLSFGVDNLKIDVTSGDSSRESISAIDELIEYTTQIQGKIGSTMNALDSVLGNNTQTQINLTDSNSRLIDADIAKESAEIVKNQIRQNMTASLLTQTGTNMSQIVLALYGL